MLAIQGGARLATLSRRTGVLEVRVVDVEAIVVVAAHHHPVGRFLAVQAVGRDQDQHIGAGVEGLHQLLLIDLLMVHRNAGLCTGLGEAFMGQCHHPLFLLVPHALEKQRSVEVDPGLCAEAAALCRQRQSQGVAAAVAGSHVDGGGFTPDLDFLQRRGLIAAVQPGHRHHQRGGAAAEGRGLGDPGHGPGVPAGLEGADALFHAQGIAVVFVVVVVEPELRVAELTVEADGALVVAGHLQAQVQGAGLPRLFFGSQQQTPGHTAPAGLRGDGQGVQPRQPGAPAQQYQGVAEQRGPVPGDQENPVLAPQPAAETAPGQAVAVEAGGLQGQQGLEILRHGGFDV